MSSEFGRGYATCLRQFSFHAARLEEQLVIYRGMNDRHPDLFDEAHAVEMWANGASDHLYELVRPRRGLPVAEWRRAKALQDRALDIGHGFPPSSKSDPDEARTLLAEALALLLALSERGHAVATLPAAMETDRALGLRPDAGSWSCSEDLRRSA